MLNRTCSLSVVLITLSFLSANVALADPQPLPSSVLNSSGVQLDTSVHVPSGNPTYPVSFNFGSGGGFTATIDSTNTVMWCVDAEEAISPPTTYNADLVELSKVATDKSYVRYGNVSSSQWKLSLSGDNTPLQRYEMAAYLISQYPGLPAGPNPSNTLTDKELQTAIWEVMWNTSVSPAGSVTWSKIFNGGGALNTADENQVATYISQAQSFVNNSANASFFNNFAIVTGNGKFKRHPHIGLGSSNLYRSTGQCRNGSGTGLHCFARLAAGGHLRPEPPRSSQTCSPHLLNAVE